MQSQDKPLPKLKFMFEDWDHQYIFDTEEEAVEKQEEMYDWYRDVLGSKRAKELELTLKLWKEEFPVLEVICHEERPDDLIDWWDN
jgi:hypothetical protein